MVFSPFDSLSTFCVHVQIHVHQRATEVTCISGTLVKLYYLSSSRQDKFADKMGFAEMFPTHMDFEGQGRAERISRYIITLFGVVGLIWGAFIQQFSQTVYILVAGVLLTLIVSVPPWPIYRRKPLNWQKARNVDGTDESKKKAKK